MFLRDGKFRSKLAKAEARLRAFAAKADKIASSMSRTTLAGGMTLAISANEYIKFERQMANVSTMLMEPERHLKQFSKAVREMSKEFGEATDHLTRGLYDILSASVAPEHALEVLRVSARAAKGGFSDTATAADATTTILNAYAMEADQAAHVSDMLFTTVRRGKIRYEELAQSIGMVATTASAAGVPIEELLALISTLTRAGMRAERSVTAARAIINSFMSPGPQQAEAARQLGIELHTSTLKAVGLMGVFKQLSKFDFGDLGAAFPNIRAITGLAPALQKLTGYEHDLMLQSNSAGEELIAFGKATDTAGFKVDQLWQSIKDLAKTVGAGLVSSIIWVGQGMKDLADWMNVVAKANEGIVRALGYTVFAMGAVVTTAVTLASAAKLAAVGLMILGATGTTIAKLGGAFLLLAQGVEYCIIWIWAFVDAVATANTVALASMLSNPWLIAGVAIAAAAAAVYIYLQNTGEAVKTTQELAEAAKSVQDAFRKDVTDTQQKANRARELLNLINKQREAIEKVRKAGGNVTAGLERQKTLVAELIGLYPQLAGAMGRSGDSKYDAAAAARLVRDNERQEQATNRQENIKRKTEQLKEQEAALANIPVRKADLAKRLAMAQARGGRQGYEDTPEYKSQAQAIKDDEARLKQATGSTKKEIAALKAIETASQQQPGQDHSENIPLTADEVHEQEKTKKKQWLADNKDIIEDLEDAKTASIENVEKREQRALYLKYRRTYDDAKAEGANGKALQMINDTHTIEKQNIIDKHAKKAAVKAKKLKKEEARDTQQIEDESLMLRIKARGALDLVTHHGDREAEKILKRQTAKELLAEEKRQALRDNPKNKDEIERQFEFKGKLQRDKWALSDLDETQKNQRGSQGIFNVRALQSLQGHDIQKDIHKEVKGVNKNTKQLAKDSKRNKGLLFA